MRIHFVSDERPSRVAKSLKKHLAELGHDLPFSTVREATASMYGYRNWNDLRGQVGKAPASVPDQESSSDMVALRRSSFVDRLSAVLAIPRSAAEAAVDAVGPTSRRQPASETYDFEQDILSAAKLFTAKWSISDHPSGKVGFSASRTLESRRIKLPQSGSISIDADGMVEESGLDLDDVMVRSTRQVESEPDARVLEFLRRLDPQALRLLRSVRRIDRASYEIAKSIPRTSAWAQLVEKLPLLSSEIATLAHDRHSGFDVDPDSLRERMIRSDDPMTGYMSIIERYASKSWPGLRIDRDSARNVVETLGTCVIHHDLGLLPWHTAFLSFAPADMLPRNQKTMAEAFGFIERWTTLFGTSVGMAPADFFREFDGDWRKADESHVKDHTLWMLFGTVADILTRSAAHDLDRPLEGDLMALDGNAAVHPLTHAVRSAIVSGKGLTSYAQAMNALRREIHDLPEEASDEDHWNALVASKVIPASLIASGAAETIANLGMNPEEYLDAVEAEDPELSTLNV